MRFMPPAMLIAAVAWLASRWDSLPARWVVHRGPGGVPNGWATKTLGGVFGPLLFGVGLALFLELIAVAIERTNRTRVSRLAHAYGNFVRWVSIAVVGIVALLAVLLPSSSPPSPRVVLGVCFGAIALALVAGGRGLAVAMNQMKAEGESLPKGYGAFLYRNPEDRRLWVPKLVGIGWTLNFAHPTAWLLLGVLLLPALVVLVVTFVAAK